MKSKLDQGFINHMMAVYGKIEEFNAEREAWDDYIDKLDNYFSANDINDEKKQAAIFLTVIGSETYSLLKNLLAPDKLTGKPVKALSDVLKIHLNPKPIEIAERYKFYLRGQLEGESLKQYIAELRKLAEHCNFNAFFEEVLRDRYVCCLHDGALRQRLLIEKDLTLKKAIEISQCLDVAKTENALLGIKNFKSEKTFTLQSKYPPLKRRCYRCNDERHLANACRFKEICNSCGIRDHIAKACRGSNRKGKLNEAGSCKYVQSTKEKGCTDIQPNQVTRYSDNFDNEESEDSNMYYIHQISSREPYMITLEVNSKAIPFEIDTGYEKLFYCNPLQQCRMKVKSYTGEKVPMFGMLKVKVCHQQNEIENLNLYVFDGKGSNLLGRNWLNVIKLNWNNVIKLSPNKEWLNKVEEGTQLPDELRALIDKHSSLFSHKLGKDNGFKAKLNVKENAVPRFMKARPIPFSLKEAVIEEIERLEKEGILRPVSYSDWASPIVIVTRPDGRIRMWRF